MGASRPAARPVGHSELECDRVPGLVQGHVSAPGDFKDDCATEPPVLDDAGEGRPFRPELCHRLLEVVAHERDLVVLGPPSGRMDAQLRGPGPENEPSIVGVHVRPTEHVPEEGPSGVGIIRMDERMETGDHPEDSRRAPVSLHAHQWCDGPATSVTPQAFSDSSPKGATLM
jgi:hypothetical protein